jgi:hypothetical protein
MRTDLETTLARSLLRPLGANSHGSAPLTLEEADVLWQLTQTPSPSLGLRLIEEAFRDPFNSHQLQARAGFALHAAIGLSPQKRAAVRALLLRFMRQPDRDPDQRRHAAALASAVGGMTSAEAEEVARFLVNGLTSSLGSWSLYQRQTRLGKYEERLLVESHRGLTLLAPSLAPVAASRIALSCIGLMDEAGTRRLEVARELPGKLSPLAPCLRPQDAARVARRLLRYIHSDAAGIDQQTALAKALAILAARMEPNTAAEVCTRAARPLELSLASYPQVLVGLGALAPYFEPQAASNIVALVRQAQLSWHNHEQMALDDPEPFYYHEGRHFYRASFNALVLRMTPEQAARSGINLLQSIPALPPGQPDVVRYARAALAGQLEVIAPHIRGDVAPEVADALVQLLEVGARNNGFQRTNVDGEYVDALLECLASLGVHVPRTRFDGLAIRACAVTNRLSGVGRRTAVGLGHLLPYVSARSAGHVLRSACRDLMTPETAFVLAEASTGIANDGDARACADLYQTIVAARWSAQTSWMPLDDMPAGRHLHRALSLMASKLDATEATHVAESLMARLRAWRVGSNFDRDLLAQAFSIVAVRLRPADAARLTALLLRDQTRKADPQAGWAAYWGCCAAALAEQLDERTKQRLLDEAATGMRLSIDILRRASGAVGRRQVVYREPQAFARAVVTLAGRMERGAAARLRAHAAAVFVRAFIECADYTRMEWSEGVRTVAPWLTSADATRLLVELAAGLEGTTRPLDRDDFVTVAALARSIEPEGRGALCKRALVRLVTHRGQGSVPEPSPRVLGLVALALA